VSCKTRNQACTPRDLQVSRWKVLPRSRARVLSSALPIRSREREHALLSIARLRAQERLRRLPKVELHAHLSGSVSQAKLKEPLVKFTSFTNSKTKIGMHPFTFILSIYRSILTNGTPRDRAGTLRRSLGDLGSGAWGSGRLDPSCSQASGGLRSRLGSLFPHAVESVNTL